MFRKQTLKTLLMDGSRERKAGIRSLQAGKNFSYEKFWCVGGRGGPS